MVLQPWEPQRTFLVHTEVTEWLSMDIRIEEEEITGVSLAARALKEGHKLVIWWDLKKMGFYFWGWFIWGASGEARGLLVKQHKDFELGKLDAKFPRIIILLDFLHSQSYLSHSEGWMRTLCGKQLIFLLNYFILPKGASCISALKLNV